MSELVVMRHRIKAIETIKKVTHAMRLISMSSHTRLRAQKKHIEEYQTRVSSIIENIQGTETAWDNTVLWPKREVLHSLIIVVGSQKGLCGNFNVNLLSKLSKKISEQNVAKTSLITVGKKVVDLMAHRQEPTLMQFSNFSTLTAGTIAQTIADHIWNAQTTYDSVDIFYNYPRSFFAQVPENYSLIPFSFASKEKTEKSQTQSEDYIWEQDQKTILNALGCKLLHNSIHNVLVQSLISEQAARFVAMDSSTRNAKNLLDTMKLQYNKTRQTKITRELTDLSASF